MKHEKIQCAILTRAAFNWTKVELKQGYYFNYVVPTFTFNWTKVELKQINGIVNGKKVNTFNWTKVELKHIFCPCNPTAPALLIELR